MNVPSLSFLAFALGGALVFNLLAWPWWRALVLLLLNLYLIHSFAPGLLPLLPFAGFVALGYVGVVLRRASDRTSGGGGYGRLYAWAFPLAVLLAFVWLKRYLFVPDALLLPRGYVAVGLSYVFFRVMHVVIDGWEDIPRGAGGLLSYFNYAINFTSLVSGPIQRYDEYHACETRPLPLDLRAIGVAAERVTVGFFKVYIVSGLLGSIQSAQIAALAADPTADWPIRQQEAFVVAGIYPLFLYFNFSGYTDFVIGLARLFRIELPENFDRPFAATNFINFWARWHITLSQWLKSYVYSPLLLSLMRRLPAPGIQPLLGVFAYFCTFFLVGVWHGQSSEFLFFGILQGGGVAANKLYQEAMIRALGRPGYGRLARRPLYVACCRGLTFTWFTFTLLWFWSSWGQLRGLTTVLSWSVALAVWPLIFVVATAVLAVLVRLSLAVQPAEPGGGLLASRYLRTASATALVVVILAATLVVSAPAPQIVYKSF